MFTPITSSAFLNQAAFQGMPGVSARVQPLAHAALLGQRPAGLAADLWWEGGARDHFQAIPGAQVRRVPFEALNPSPNEQDQRILAEIRENLKARRLWATGHRVLEVKIPRHLAASADPINIPMLLSRFEAAVGGAARLIDASPEHQTYFIPSLSFFESALRTFYGEEAARWVSVLGALLRDEINAHHREGAQPIALPREPLLLGDFKEIVHPFIFAFHDLYHAVRMAVLPKEIRQMGVSLYDAIQRLPENLRNLEFVEPTLDLLADFLDFSDSRPDGFLKPAFYPMENEIRMLVYKRNHFRDSEDVEFYKRFVAALLPEWIPHITSVAERRARSHLEEILRIFPERPELP